MSRVTTIRHRFVTSVPLDMEEATLYVSVEFGTCMHKCFCGCGAEVVTPLSPRQWTLTYDGDAVSLRPSVGSWSLPCQSHYVIRRNRVHWARRFTDDEIAVVRERDRAMLAADPSDAGQSPRHRTSASVSGAPPAGGQRPASARKPRSASGRAS
jgi:hypothetical protein